MITIIMESSIMILLMIGFRKLCRNLISMKVIYGLWLIVVFRMLPFGLIWRGETYSIVLELFSRVMSFLPNCRYVYFDFAVIRIPWYLLVLWAIGGVVVFLWECFVNIKFERFLFENRVSVVDESCPYPVYSVSDIQSSCIFRVKGQAGIYLKEAVLKEPEVYQTILSHEICHMKARDLFWAKLRLLFVAVYWFNPLVWIAAFLSKEDCEMACDERTVALLKMRKSSYGKILLNEVNTAILKTKDEIFCVATTMVSNANGLRVRIEHLAARTYNKYIQFLIGSVFVLCCIILCFWGRRDFQDMNGEETIRQYVYYSNADYQEGMQRLSLCDEWDYFFPNKLEGEILEIRKVNVAQSINNNKNYKNEIYQIKMKEKHDGIMRQEKYVVLLVKQKEGDNWKIDWR